MTKKAFDRIAEGLNEAIAVARGEAEPAKVHIPPEIDVRALRRKLKLTQEDFAYEYGFTINQIRDWEQNRSRPIGAHRAYLMIIEHAPESVRQLLRDAA